MALLVLALAGCGESRDSGFQGYVEAEFTYLASPQSGYLDKLAVARGETIKAGQAVFSLSNQAVTDSVAEARSRLQQAGQRLADMKKGARPSELEGLEAQLSQASSSLEITSLAYKRRKKLFSQKAIPQADLDNARALYDRDLARVAQAKAQLVTARLGARTDQIAAAASEVAAISAVLKKASWTQSQLARTAPVGGLIFDTYFTRGEWVPAGRPVASLLAPGNIKVRFFVPEPLVATFKPGQAVGLSCDGCAEGMTGRITYISPQAEYTPPVIYSAENRAKLVFMIEAKPDADQPALKPGQPMSVHPAPGGAAK